MGLPVPNVFCGLSQKDWETYYTACQVRKRGLFALMDHYKDVIDITLQLVSAVSSLVFCRKQNSESLGNVEKKKVGVH